MLHHNYCTVLLTLTRLSYIISIGQKVSTVHIKHAKHTNIEQQNWKLETGIGNA